jgi:hypothetical protein
VCFVPYRDKKLSVSLCVSCAASQDDYSLILHKMLAAAGYAVAAVNYRAVTVGE